MKGKYLDGSSFGLFQGVTPIFAWGG